MENTTSRIKLNFVFAAIFFIKLTFYSTNPSFASVEFFCEESNILIVQDKSGSMDSYNKWNSAKNAIQIILNSYDYLLRFGLALFPMGDECQVGQVVVDVGSDTSQDIMNNLNATSPLGATPMADTLNNMINYSGLYDPERRNFIILITDGMDTCANDPTNEPVNAVRNLRANNIMTFVIGFGTGVDPNVLSQMAQEGGTARDNPPYYYQADNPTELITVIEDVLDEITTEVCDAKDNDCDGIVDENLIDNCDRGRGWGPGFSVCEDGIWSECEEAFEACDGFDNDEDGLIDEGTDLCFNSEMCICGKCVEPCFDGGTCRGSLSCVMGFCIPSDNLCCATQCPGGFKCDKDTGECIEKECEQECSSGYECRGGECVYPDCFSQGNECPETQICTDGYCITDSCVTMSCDPETQICINGHCMNSCHNIICEQGELCINGDCIQQLCDPRYCSPEQICVDGECVRDPCYDIECINFSEICVEGTCMADPCFYLTCPEGSSCLGGQCYPNDFVDEVENRDGTNPYATENNNSTNSSSNNSDNNNNLENISNLNSSSNSSSNNNHSNSSNQSSNNDNIQNVNNLNNEQNPGETSSVAEESGCNCSIL